MSDIPTTHRIPEDVMRALEAPSLRVPVELLAENARLRAELAEAKRWNQEMVAKAASGGVLDGYRELGAKVAAAERDLDAAKAEAERLREALNAIAAWDDHGANRALERDGTYGCFDEPGSVQIARAALQEKAHD